MYYVTKKKLFYLIFLVLFLIDCQKETWFNSTKRNLCNVWTLKSGIDTTIEYASQDTAITIYNADSCTIVNSIEQRTYKYNETISFNKDYSFSFVVFQEEGGISLNATLSGTWNFLDKSKDRILLSLTSLSTENNVTPIEILDTLLIESLSNDELSIKSYNIYIDKNITSNKNYVAIE